MKNPQSCNFIFVSEPSLFYGHYYKNQKEPGTSYQSLFRLPNISIISLMIHYLGNFVALIQRFWSYLQNCN